MWPMAAVAEDVMRVRYVSFATKPELIRQAFVVAGKGTTKNKRSKSETGDKRARKRRKQG
jgi:hypothetical protein